MTLVREHPDSLGEHREARRRADGEINRAKTFRLPDREGRRQFHAVMPGAGEEFYENDRGEIRSTDTRWVDEGGGIFAVRKHRLQTTFDANRLQIEYASRKTGNELTWRLTRIGDVPLRDLPLNIAPVIEPIRANHGTNGLCVTLPNLLPGLDFYVSFLARLEPGWIVHSGYTSPAAEPFAWTEEVASADLSAWPKISAIRGQENINETTTRTAADIMRKLTLVREPPVTSTRNRRQVATFRSHWTGEVTVRQDKQRFLRASSDPADIEYPVRIR